jgi:hypothetical protein
MTPVGEQKRWEVLEKVGAYAAGELEGEEAREAEQLIFERPDYWRLAESYARMLVMLSTLGDEPVEAPEAIASYAYHCPKRGRHGVPTCSNQPAEGPGAVACGARAHDRGRARRDEWGPGPRGEGVAGEAL